jgi:general secretion pathway protein A
MYEKFFALTERPFSIAPDPRFLYMSQQHREALAHLLYGVAEGGGFVQLTGDVGTGKTTVCRCFLEQVPEQVDVALILNPRISALELLASLCDELRIEYVRQTTSIKTLIDALNTYLLDAHSRGRRTVLIIDEAQNLGAEALEQVRLLTNLETTREKLLQIILIGQPELRELLARDDLRQLAQRITARYHLEPIGRDETAAYIRHRLQVCGESQPVFTEGAIDLVQRLSGGVPRLINVLCDRAMLGAFVEGRKKVDEAILVRAAREVLPEEGGAPPARRIWRWAAGSAAVALVAVLSVTLYFNRDPPPSARVAAELASAPAAATRQAPRVAPALSPSVSAARETSAPAPALPSTTSPETTPDPGAPGRDAAGRDASGLDAGGRDAGAQLTAMLASSSPQAATRAWAALYRMWGVEAHAVSDEQACAQAPSVGLRCLQGGGSWAVLRHFDRPAVILLVGPEGRRVPALLGAVDGHDVKIQLDGDSLQLPVDTLLQFWFGEYRLLWKTPPGGRTALRSGDRSEDVKWLRERLRQVTGMTSIAPDPLRFDEGLKQLLQTFQRDSELNPDGVAGARTIIHLNNLSSIPDVPRLGAVTEQG